MPSLASADIVINEIMQDPSKVSDLNGEWFEVFNNTNHNINLQDCVIADSGGNFHIINSSLIVPTGGYSVLGASSNPAVNGGAAINYQYSSFNLGNTDDEIFLSCNNIEIDRVEYTGVSPWPDPTGKSMILASPILDNNLGSNWCVSSSAYGAGDLGTPGTANDMCAGVAYCGNGIQEGSEMCDDGTLNGTAGHCKSDCTGLIPLPGSLKFCKYEDADGNIIETTNDQTAVNNWVFEIGFNSSTTTATTTQDGCVTISDLTAGEYFISEQMLAGWTPVSPGQATTTDVIAGQETLIN